MASHAALLEGRKAKAVHFRPRNLIVEFMLGLLAQGWSEVEILRNYPGLTRDQIWPVWAYAQQTVGNLHFERLLFGDLALAPVLKGSTIGTHTSPLSWRWIWENRARAISWVLL